MPRSGVPVCQTHANVPACLSVRFMPRSGVPVCQTHATFRRTCLSDSCHVPACLSVRFMPRSGLPVCQIHATFRPACLSDSYPSACPPFRSWPSVYKLLARLPVHLKSASFLHASRLPVRSLPNNLSSCVKDPVRLPAWQLISVLYPSAYPPICINYCSHCCQCPA